MEESEKEKRSQMMGHTLRHGGLLRDILEGEVGKKRGRGGGKEKGTGMRDI